MPEFQIFLSSIFRDMEREREALSRIVMPKIRKECESRGVSFSYIDLRWGIDDDLLLQGQVVGHCLNLIDATTPVFLGLIGPRYGSILPHPGAPDLSATHHEFRRAFQAGRELIFLICDTKDCRDARVSQPGLVQMLEETPVEARSFYSDLEGFIALSERQLMAVLDRLHPRGVKDDQVVDSAMRQEQFGSVIRSRMVPLWKGEAAQTWLGFLYGVTNILSKDTESTSGVYPIITQTAGDAEVIAVELAAFYRQHGPEQDLVFEHACRIENDRSAAWAMRRLLAFLATVKDIELPPLGEPSDAQVQVLLNVALADLAQKKRHLLVVLSGANPVEMLLYMRPLLLSPSCSIVTALTESEAERLPVTINAIAPPRDYSDLCRTILRGASASAGKAVALKEKLLDTLTSSLLCSTLTGTMLLADWLMAWGDLNPDRAASQDEWLQAEVERVARLSVLEVLSSEVLSAVGRVMAPILPDFETLAKALLDCLRVAPVSLTLDEVHAIAAEVLLTRKVAAEVQQIPLTMTYLAKAFTSIDVMAQTYRLVDAALWREPEDADAIRSAIVQVLTERPTDPRRAEGAARCAIATGREKDRRKVLRAAGFAAQIELSLLTALAAELDDVARQKLEALQSEYTPHGRQLLIDDALALISALAAHDTPTCMDLAENIARDFRTGTHDCSVQTSKLAARAQTALDSVFSRDEAEWRSLGGSAASPHAALKSALCLHEVDPDRLPREAQDFLHNIRGNIKRELPPQLGLVLIQNDLKHSIALDALGNTAATVALDMIRRILNAGLGHGPAEDVIRKLSAFAVKLTIASEEARFANAGAPILSDIDRYGIRSDAFITTHDSIVEQIMKEMLELLWAAREREEASDELFLCIVKRLVETLARSDRRCEYSQLLRMFPASSVHDSIKRRWSQCHHPREREHAAETLVSALTDLRGVACFG